jgi:dnd system-associated protein 4
MDRRIAPPGGAELRGILDKLTNPQPGYDFPFFETKQKAIMFAAALGRHLGTRKPIESRDSASAIRFDIFQKAVDDGFISALAIAEKNSLTALNESSEEQMVTVFEEYAHSGLAELRRRCFESGTDILEAILELVSSGRQATADPDDTGVDAELLRDLVG